LFVRKELETVTAEKVGLLQDAVRLAFVNAYNGKNYRVFRKRIARDESITDDEVQKLAAACKDNPPWVPWR